jgi:hypothetical protein
MGDSDSKEAEDQAVAMIAGEIGDTRVIATARKAVEDIDNVYDAELEQELLLQIVEPRYVNMLSAIHHLVQTTFPDMEHFRLDDAATRSMLEHAAEQVVRIDETTRAAIREQLSIGQKRGYSAWEIANGVPRDDYRGIEGLFQETWQGRANTVARNELLEAQHTSSLERYAATGLVDRVQLRDGTGTAPDAPCLARNGQVVPLSSRPERLHVNCSVVVIPILRGE